MSHSSTAAEGHARLDILVCDHDSGIRTLLRDLLEEIGARVTSAADARQLAELLGSRHFDVMVIDSAVAEEPEDLDRLTQAAPEMRVVVMYGSVRCSRPSCRVPALRADAAITKPFKCADIVSALGTLLRS